MNILGKVAVVSTLVMTALATVSTSYAKPSHVEDKYFTIGTAGVTGVYYPAGGAICRFVSRSRDNHGYRCAVESTGGSIYNLNAIRHGDIDIGIAQSDWQYHAYNGTALFERVGPDKDLRTVFTLHPEPFTLVVRGDANINTFDDLKGKRVNVGNPGSGMRATMEVLLAAKGWTIDDLGEALEYRAAEQGQALCDGRIDVMVYAAGHPNGAVQEVAANCNAKLIPIEGEVVANLIKKYPFYTVSTIPGGMYSNNPTDVKTFGVTATVVTSASEDEELVYQVVKSVFENFDQFKTMHPVFSTLQKTHMIKDGSVAPLHKGAERYFKEAGLLK